MLYLLCPPLVRKSDLILFKIFLVPRSLNDSFPTTVTVLVDGTTIGTYTATTISNANGMTISYSGTGYYIRPNVRRIEGEYDSKSYQKARNSRSAVESLMFTLKNNNDLDRVMRRGINNVRSELLEKVIAYNFDRMILIRKRQQVENDNKQAA